MGTFSSDCVLRCAGADAQIPHLVELGVTAVEVLPVFEYDELEFQRSPNPRDHMINIWGYSHLSFFAPMARFGSGGRGPAAAARELKQLVKALHAAGIEVLLDVVYNHTVEGVHAPHCTAGCVYDHCLLQNASAGPH